MSSGDILTKRGIAELLQVSERTVERWMAEGSMRYVPLPKRDAWSEARFLRTEIVEWIRKRTVRPVRVSHGVVNAQARRKLPKGIHVHESRYVYWTSPAFRVRLTLRWPTNEALDRSFSIRSRSSLAKNTSIGRLKGK